jgi:uncharacterized integral membrane protein
VYERNKPPTRKNPAAKKHPKNSPKNSPKTAQKTAQKTPQKPSQKPSQKAPQKIHPETTQKQRNHKRKQNNPKMVGDSNQNLPLTVALVGFLALVLAALLFALQKKPVDSSGQCRQKCSLPLVLIFSAGLVTAAGIGFYFLQKEQILDTPTPVHLQVPETPLTS